MDSNAISSKNISVNNYNIHTIHTGKGKPVVFIHGIPTSSYIWRNIIPQIALRHECYALDLIGMGESDKPDIAYSIKDYVYYFEGFMQQLNLSDQVSLVMHGWGSIIGLDYARRHPEKIRNLALIEPYLNVLEDYSEISTSVNEFARLAAGDPEKLKYFVIEQNFLLENMMPALMAKKLSEKDMKVYRKPFEKKDHRKLLLQYVLEQPFRNKESLAVEMIGAHTAWLEETSLPKLLMYGMPGFLIRMNSVIWAMNHLLNLTVVEVGNDFHYLQESCGPKIQETLVKWLQNTASG